MLAPPLQRIEYLRGISAVRTPLGNPESSEKYCNYGHAAVRNIEYQEDNSNIDFIPRAVSQIVLMSGGGGP